MATSGTTSFTVTRDEIIGAALRLCGVFGSGDTIPATDVTNCAQALNIIVKAWGAQGLNLWANAEKSLTPTAGTASYQIGLTATGTGAMVTDVPLRILDSAFVRVAGVDTKVQVISRFDYNLIGSKTTAGLPSQLFYDPQVPNGQIYLYPVPTSAGQVVHFISQRHVQDFSLSTNNADVPQEWYQLLKWNLADEIALEYEVSLAKAAAITAKATQLRMLLTGYVDQVFAKRDNQQPKTQETA